MRGYEQGKFGNASPTWKTFADFDISLTLGDVRRDELVHVRNRIAGGPTYYNVAASAVGSVCLRYTAIEGGKLSDLYLSLMCPTLRTTFQGEAYQTRDGRGLALFGSTVRKPMRDSLAEGGVQYYGVASLAIIKQYMNQNSYEWFCRLLDTYPEHVIEFTCLDTCWGTVPGFNTIYWEVRAY